MTDKYTMLYCDNAQCRVNTFECGDGSEHKEKPGLCPGCAWEGEELA